MQDHSILKLLHSYGLEAWYCGGTARDFYMGIEPNNYDIAVKSNFKDLRDKLESRIISVNEYATYIKIEYKHIPFYIYPLKKVELENTYYNFSFTDKLEEDASTRDFTINSLYYNPLNLNEQWLDFFNGRKDIDNKCIKFINDPYIRILESKIRILRAPAFCSRFGENWFIEPNSKTAIQSEAIKLLSVNPKQINNEIYAALTYSKVPSKFFYELKDLKILDSFFPELLQTLDIQQTNKAEHLNLFQHTLLTLDKIPNDLINDRKLILRLAALLHDIGKPYTKTNINGDLHFYQHEHVGAYIAEKILNRWGFNKPIVNKISHLINNHLFDSNPQRSTSIIRKFIHKIGAENIHDLLELRAADRLGNTRSDIDMKYFNQFKFKINKILEQDAPKYFNLSITEKELRNLVEPLTNKAAAVIPKLENHLKTLIRLKIIYNKKNKIIEYLNGLLDTKCPLDIEHLIDTWTKIYENKVETFPNGNLKCGIYCEFICNKLLENRVKNE